MSKKRVARSSVSRTVSRKSIAKRLASQESRAKATLQKNRAEKALRHFRPRKAERGKLVFIGVKGQRYATPGKRKGYLAYISKNGKKTLLKQKKNEYRPSKINDAQAPLSKRFRKISKNFTRGQSVKNSFKKPVLRGSGKAITSGQYDFNDKVVAKISSSIKKVIEGQRSHRRFNISIISLVQLPDGNTRTYETITSIERADHDAIQLAGIENFVRRKFYAFMARELQFDGLVSSGSANHIRAIKANRGKKRSEWVDDSGGAWRGRDDSVVKIKTIEWKIEQAK